MELIQRQDGKWFLAMPYCMSEEPKIITNFFRVTWAESYPTPGFAYRTTLQGVYTDCKGVRFNVEEHSSEVKIDEVPKPKRIKSELRWHDGWQKMTRNGWVAC